MTAPIDYSAVLADLEAKRGQIDAAIAVIRALIGGAVTGDAATVADAPIGDDAGATVAPLGPSAARAAVARAGGPQALDPNAFFKMGTAAAIKKYLGIVKRPQTARVIADALHDGGQVHAADPKTAYLNVQSALRRNTEVFVQTRTKEWGLTEWFGSGKGE